MWPNQRTIDAIDRLTDTMEDFLETWQVFECEMSLDAAIEADPEDLDAVADAIILRDMQDVRR